jgi:pyruvate kinase
MTDKDREDLQFGLEHKVDVVALSFVRRASDVREIKQIIHKHGSDTPVIAKLEKPQAIENLDDIFDIADGVMVARGDLGVEMPPEQVPVIQKHIIARASEWRKPVITATQMLESMIDNPRPTRAETSDVANAIFDGSDAVMLSGETARGKYPRQTVEMMARIICEAESHFEHRPHVLKHSRDRRLSVAETICESVAHAADDLTMRAIAVFTETGTTARLVSKYRPRCLVYGFADTQRVCNRLNLLWGVQPYCVGTANSIVEMVKSGEQYMLQRGAVKAGDVIGIVTGTRQSAGFTNIMWLHTVGGEQQAHTPERRKQARYRPPTAKRKAPNKSAEE